MGKKTNRITAAALAAVAGTVAASSVAGADSGVVETRLPDVSQVSLTDLASSEDSVLTNSIRQVQEEADTPYGPLGAFESAPPPN